MSTEIETGTDQPDAAASGVSRPRPGEAEDGHRPLDELNPEEHGYEPHRVGLPPLGPYIRELWRRREFAFERARTNLRAQHFDAAFGQLWLVLNPLPLSMVDFILVGILRHGHRPPGFFAHLVAG